MGRLGRYGRYGAAAALAAVLAVAGCGTTPDRPAPPEVLVEVVVEGGLAGVGTRLVVREDGSYTVTSRAGPDRAGRMTPDGAAALRAALTDPAYARVPARPTAAPVADGLTYTVVHDGRRVVTHDGADAPPALRRVLDALPGGGPPTAP